MIAPKGVDVASVVNGDACNRVVEVGERSGENREEKDGVAVVVVVVSTFFVVRKGVLVVVDVVVAIVGVLVLGTRGED